MYTPKKEYKRKFVKYPKKDEMTKVDKSLSDRIKKIEGEIEWKYTDTYSAYQTIPYEGPAGSGTGAWYVTCVNTSVLGASQVGQRIGTQINSKLLNLRISLLQHTANILDNRVRICIFWYKNSNTLLPIPQQLFDTSVAPPTFAFYNDQYKESFKIIYDETFELKPLDWNGTNTTIADQISINKNLRIGRKVKYVTGNGAGTYADILDNSLYVAFMTSANSGAAGVNNPQALLSTRY